MNKKIKYYRLTNWKLAANPKHMRAKDFCTFAYLSGGAFFNGKF
nr:MAG TPA_asm: hypothetical protein [Caudoviricetes sp.]